MLLCSITVLLSFLFVDTYIPMDTYTNESCMIGLVHISTIVHSSAQTSSLLRLLWCTPGTFVNSVTPKFGISQS